MESDKSTVADITINTNVNTNIGSEYDYYTTENGKISNIENSSDSKKVSWLNIMWRQPSQKDTMDICIPIKKIQPRICFI